LCGIFMMCGGGIGKVTLGQQSQIEGKSAHAKQAS
jgi:hypothetical protein